MARLFDIDFSGYADDTALESISSGFVTTYYPSRLLKTVGGLLTGYPYGVESYYVGLSAVSREFGVVLNYVVGLDKDAIWAFRLLDLPSYVAKSDRLEYKNGAWVLSHEYTTVCSIADPDWAPGVTRTIVAKIDGTAWSLTVNGTTVNGTSAVGVESTDFVIAWNGTTGNTGIGPCIASMYLDDLQSGGGGTEYESTIYGVLDGVSGSISASYSPANDISMSGTLDGVTGAASLEVSTVELAVSGTLDGVSGAVGVSSSHPVDMSMSGSLDGVYGSVQADISTDEIAIAGTLEGVAGEAFVTAEIGVAVSVAATLEGVTGAVSIGISGATLIDVSSTLEGVSGSMFAETFDSIEIPSFSETFHIAGSYRSSFEMVGRYKNRYETGSIVA